MNEKQEEMTSDLGLKQMPCSVCGRPTTMLGTELCNPCWEMKRGLRYFVFHDRARARAWLAEQLKELDER